MSYPFKYINLNYFETFLAKYHNVHNRPDASSNIGEIPFQFCHIMACFRDWNAFTTWVISLHPGWGWGWGYWSKFWRGCAAGERQNPPMSKGVERTRQAPCLRRLSPWRPICMDPHPISYHLPCPASHYSNHQMVIALLCKYIQCQLPQLSISGCQTR